MADQQPAFAREVDAFILHRIDSVPHLEALLLVWRSREEWWTVDQLSKRLWIKPEQAASILRDLVREGLLQTAEVEERYRYFSEPDRDRLIQQLETTYAREMIRISNMIHAKPSSAVREFARAFRFKKEQE